MLLLFLHKWRHPHHSHFSVFLFWAHRFDNCFPPHPDPVLPSTFCDMFAGHTIRSGKVRIPTSNGLLHDPNYVYGHLDQDIMKKRWTALGEVSPYIHHLKAASSNRCVCYASILLRTIGSFGLKPSPTVRPIINVTFFFEICRTRLQPFPKKQEAFLYGWRGDSPLVADPTSACILLPCLNPRPEVRTREKETPQTRETQWLAKPPPRFKFKLG